jgi:hypothetical protein
MVVAREDKPSCTPLSELRADGPCFLVRKRASQPMLLAHCRAEPILNCRPPIALTGRQLMGIKPVNCCIS